jgi:hypothetical protein
MPLSFHGHSPKRLAYKEFYMEKKSQTPQGQGSRAGAIIYIVVAILSIWFFYWFGNIGATSYSGH